MIESQEGLLAEVRINRTDEVRYHLQRERGGLVTDEEIEAFQQDLRASLDQGRVQVEATRDHEVMGMFMAANEIAEVIAAKTTWTVIHSEAPNEFVISDHPVSIYDPDAPPGHGVGWVSSPNVESTLPVSRFECLSFRPGPAVVREEQASAARVADINLRSYASTEWAYYGSGQRIVQGVRADARRQRGLVSLYEPRKPHLFVLEKKDESEVMFVTRNYTPKGKPVRGFIRPASRN
jgi:hypothetical protein